MLYFIQFLRFAAALLVVGLHTYSAVDHQIKATAMGYAFEFGAVGVHIFFVISGFIMVYTQRARFGSARPVEFLARRIDRIYPLYWFCCAVTVAVIVAFDAMALPNSPAQWIRALLLIDGDKIIFVGWTLAYEMYFYIMFAAALAVGLKMRGTLILLSCVFFALVALGMLADLEGTLTGVLLLEFVLGAWIAYWTLKFPQGHYSAGVALTVLGIAGFGAGLIVGYDIAPRVATWGLPSGMLIAGLVLMETARPSRVRKWAILGDASYALYLIHPAVIIVLIQPVSEWPTIDLPAFGALLAVSLAVNVYVSVVIVKHLDARLRFGRVRAYL